MKNKYLIFNILLFLILSSCETMYSDIYSISNNTSYTINIVGFNINKTEIENYDTLYFEKIEILPYSNYQVEKKNGFQGQDPGIFNDSGIDSIIIQFNNTKRIIYVCNKPSGSSCTGAYNLMNINENYTKEKTGKSSGKDEFKFTFTFTDEDYQNAEYLE